MLSVLPVMSTYGATANTGAAEADGRRMPTMAPRAAKATAAVFATILVRLRMAPPETVNTLSFFHWTVQMPIVCCQCVHVNVRGWRRPSTKSWKKSGRGVDSADPQGERGLRGRRAAGPRDPHRDGPLQRGAGEGGRP